MNNHIYSKEKFGYICVLTTSKVVRKAATTQPFIQRNIKGRGLLKIEKENPKSERKELNGVHIFKSIKIIKLDPHLFLAIFHARKEI